jgi:hypothetical protein
MLGVSLFVYDAWDALRTVSWWDTLTSFGNKFIIAHLSVERGSRNNSSFLLTHLLSMSIILKRSRSICFKTTSCIQFASIKFIAWFSLGLDSTGCRSWSFLHKSTGLLLLKHIRPSHKLILLKHLLCSIKLICSSICISISRMCDSLWSNSHCLHSHALHTHHTSSSIHNLRIISKGIKINIE